MSKFLRSIHDRHVKSMRKQVDWIDNHYWRWIMLSLIPSALIVAIFHQTDKRLNKPYAFEDLKLPDLKITFNDDPDRDPED